MGVIRLGEPINGEYGFVFARGYLNPRKYVRGSLGMPRNEDPDSGGGQLFVTHVPTPHLDGRYSIYAQVVSGLAVIDRIRIGDKIEKATIRLAGDK